MRVIQTCILRLLVDADAPQALRGSIRSVTDEQEHPFANEQALLVLLHGMTRHLAGAIPTQEIDDAESSTHSGGIQ